MSSFLQRVNPVLPVLCSGLLCLPGLVVGAGGVGGSAVLLPVSAVGLAPALSPSKIIPMSDSFPGMSAIATDAHIPSSLPGLPQAVAPVATFVGIIHEIAERQGKAMLTQQGVAASLRGVEAEGLASLGGNLAQSAIDAGLRQIESQAIKQQFVRNLSLNWAPGFNGREDLYQIDAILSLYDGSRSSLMTQLGLQGRNGETGLNAGVVLRTQSFENWILGLNAFYDYLSEPEVDRWSAGMELKGRWLGFSGNIYLGLDEDVSGSEVMYSPDGWDVELSGHVPDLPWLEYSGKYYKWEGNQGDDLEGQEYKLTLRPVPMFDISLRYDSVQDGDAGFGVETQLRYDFGRPVSEQLSYTEVATPADPWARRFERVRREYEQRVQRRGPRTSVRVVGSTVIATVASVPAGATQVVVTGTLRSGSTLTRAVTAAAGVRVHGGNCHVEGIVGVTCTLTLSTREINIINLAPGDYSFRAQFQNAVGNAVGSPVPFSATIMAVEGPVASIAVSSAAIAEAGGTTMVTVSMTEAQSSDIVVNLTRSGMATIGTDYSQSGLTELTDPTYTLTVAATTTMASFMLTAVDDSDDDDSEDIVFTIVTGAGYSPATEGAVVATITVLDDDGAMDMTAPGPVTGLTAMAGNAQVALAWTNPAATDLAMVTISATANGGAVDINGTASGNDLSITVTPNSAGSQTITGLGNNIMHTFNVVAVDHLANASTVTSASATPTVVLPQFSFRTATATVAEGGSVTVNVDYTEGSLAEAVILNIGLSGSAVVADYSTANGSAAFTSGAIRVLPGRVAPAGFTIRATADMDGTEGGETLVIMLQAGDGYMLGATTSYTLTITDVPPVASIYIGGVGTQTGTIAEASTTSATVTVALNIAAPVGGVTVNLGQSGSGTIVSDYTVGSLSGSGSSYSIMIAGGSTTATFTMTAVDDSIDDNAETAMFTVMPGTGYAPAAGGAAAVTVTITDDDGTPEPPMASLSVSTTAIAEAGGSATVTVTLSMTAPVGGVTVNLGQSGSGTIVSDYTVGSLSGSGSSYSIMIAGGSTTATFTVTAVDDSVDDDAETAMFTVMPGTGYAVAAGSSASVTVTITDDDAPPPSTPEISLSVNPTTIAEAGGIATVTVTLSSAQTTATTVRLDRTGTATVGASSDYTVATLAGTNPNYTLTVPANMTTATFMLTAVDDAVDDDDETAVFTVVAGTGYTVGSAAAVTVTITDNDTRSITSSTGGANLAVTEQSTNSYTIVLGSQPTGTVTVTLTSADTGAATVAPAMLSFSTANWNTAQTVTVAGVADTDTTNESTSISYAVSGGDYAGVTLAAQTVTVNDNDIADITATAGAGSVVLTWTNPTNSNLSSVVVSATVNGAVVDLNGATGGNDITIASAMSGASVNRSISGLTAAEHTFTIVAMDAGSTSIASGTATATPTAVVIGAPVVTVTPSATTVTEGSGAGTGGVVTLTLTLTNPPVTDVTVTVSRNGSSAAAASDYSLSAPTATLNATTLSRDITLTTTPDTVYEGDESLVLSYTVSGATGIAAVPDTTLTITEDDAQPMASVYIGVASTQTGTITEAGTSSTTVTVALSSMSGSATTVNLTRTGSATIGTGNDYTVATLAGTDPAYTLMVPALTSTATFTLTAVDDAVDDDDETAIFTVVAGSGYTPITTAAAAVTVTITDNDAASTLPEFSFQTATATENEGGFADVGMVFTGGALAAAVVVEVRISGTAMPADYSATPLETGTTPALDGSPPTISITSGSTSPRVFSVSAVANDGIEPDETVIITILDGAGYVVGSQNTFTLTIIDSDPPEEVRLPQVFDNGNGSITLGWNSPSSQNLAMARISGMADGVPFDLNGAAAGNDITIPIKPSLLDYQQIITGLSMGVLYSFNIAAVNGAGIATPSTMPLTITLQPAASIYIGNPGTLTGTIAEAGTTSITVTVALSVQAPVGGTTVILLRQGRASIGGAGDYTQTGLTPSTDPAYTLMVPVGMTTATFTLTAVDDAVDDDDETIRLSVLSGTGYARTLGMNIATVTITDNDATAAGAPTASIYIGDAGTQTGTIAEAGTTSTTVTVSLTAAAPAGGLAVNFIVSGSSFFFADYIIGGDSLEGGNGANFIFTIPEGDRSATFTVTAVDDNVDDDDEIAVFTVVPGTGYRVASGGAEVVTVTIMANDNVVIAIPNVSVYIGNPGTQIGTIAETGTTSITVTVALDAPAPPGGLTINLYITGNADRIGTGMDYTQSGLTATTDPAYELTTAGRSTTFTLTALDDDRFEGNETATVTVLAGTGYRVASGGAEAVTVTITDNDPPVTTPTASVYIGGAGTQTGTITEASTSSTTVTVALSAVAPAGGVTVNLMRGGSADIGTGMDYTQSGLTATTDPAYTLMVPVGMTTATFTLTAVDDAVDDDDETAIFTVVAGSGYTPITTAAAAVTVTITDNDAAATLPEFSFQTATATENEGESATVTVDFTGPILTENISLNISLGGTATRGIDTGDYFFAVISVTVSAASDTAVRGTINFLTALKNFSPGEFTINLNRLDGIESDETVIITILDGAGYAVGSQNTFTLTIIDTDATAILPEVSFQTATATENEGGFADVGMVFTGGALAAAVVVEVRISGTATPADYRATPLQTGITPALDGSPPTISITSGTPSPRAFNVSTVANDGIELDETLTLTIQPGAGYTVGSANTYTLTIIDNDPPATTPTASVYIGGAGTQTGTITEASTSSTTVTVALSAVAPAGGVTVNLMRGGSADIGTGMDYTQSGLTATTDPAYTLMVPVGMTTATFTLTAVDDAVDDDDETAIFTVVAGSGYTPITTAAAAVTVTITDNDAASTLPEFSFQTATATEAEDGFAVGVNIAFTGGALTTGVTLSVSLGGSAVAADYTTGDSDASATLTGASPTIGINAGMTSPVSFFILTTADTLAEGDETLIITLLDGAGYTVGSANTYTLTITDPPPPSASIAVTPAAIAEAGGVATVTVTLSSAPTTATTVNLTRTGSATIVSDYSVATLAGTDPAYTLTVAANTATATFTVTAVDDSADDDDETAVFTVATGTGYTPASGSAAVVTVTITDNDAASTLPEFSFQTATATEAEDGFAVGVNIAFTGGALTTGVTLSVSLGGSAVAADYTTGDSDASATLTGASPTIGINAGMTSPVSFFILTTADTLAEGDETLIITLLDGAGYTVGSANTYTLTITDPPPPSASIAVTPAAIAEAGGVATVTVTLSSAPTTATTVNLTRTGSATIVSDYSVATLAGTDPAYTLTVAANTATATFTVTAVDDSADDDDETAVFTVATGTGYTPASGSAAVVTVTITDNDAASTLPEFSFQTATATENEGGFADVGMVFTGGALAVAVVVEVRISGTATTADYRATPLQTGITPALDGSPPTISITSGSPSPRVFNVSTVANDGIEPDETLTLTIQPGAGYTVGSANTYTLTIVDRAPPAEVIGIMNSGGAGGEITLTWTNPSSVNLAMVMISGTADGVGFDINGGAAGNDITIAATPGSPGRQVITGLRAGNVRYEFNFITVSTAGVASPGRPSPIFNIAPTASVYIGNPGIQTGIIAEAGTTSTTVTVALSGPAGTGGVTVRLTPSGSATFGTGMDYTQSGLLNGRSILVAAGMTTATFILTAVDDAVDDDDETAIFTVNAAGSGYFALTDGSEAVTVTITDND